MKWEGEVVAVQGGKWPENTGQVTLASINGSTGTVVEIPVPSRNLDCYPIGRRVIVCVTPS